MLQISFVRKSTPTHKILCVTYIN